MIPHLPKLQSILEQYKNRSIKEVGLALSKYPLEERSFILNQLQGGKKAFQKLPSWLINDIYFPPSLNLEQCSSEISAQAKLDLLNGTSVLDLTGGFGVDSIIFAKNGHSVHHVEPSSNLQELVKHNVRVFDLSEKFTFQNATAEDVLETISGKVDTIYIDPSRRDDRHIKLVSLLDCAPNVIELLPKMRTLAKRVVIKLSPMFDIHQVIKQLPDCSLIRVIAIKNDCKELLVVFDSSIRRITPLIQTRNYLSQSEYQEFDSELPTNSNTSSSNVLGYLYDPNTAIHKAQLYLEIETAFNIKPISPQTHVFTSDTYIPNFPGRVCKVIKEIAYKKNEVSEPVMIVPRNFPDKEEVIRKKLKLKHGENHFLYAFRNQLNKPQLVFCEKM